MEFSVQRHTIEGSVVCRLQIPSNSPLQKGRTFYFPLLQRGIKGDFNRPLISVGLYLYIAYETKPVNLILSIVKPVCIGFLNLITTGIDFRL